MAVYKVVEVGSAGGGGGGCLFMAFLLAIGLFALADACDSSVPQTSGSVTVKKRPTSSSSDQTRSQSETEPAPESNSPNLTPPEPKKSEKSTSDPSRNDRSEHAFRLQYVNDGVLDRLQSDGQPVAVVATSAGRSFENRLAEALRRRGANVQTGLLKRAAFETDPVFQRLAGGDGEILRRLGLTHLSGHLVLCRLEFSTIRETRDGFTTKAFLSVALVPLEGGPPTGREFEAPGGGFTPDAAEEQALQRVRGDFLASPLTDRLTRH